VPTWADWSSRAEHHEVAGSPVAFYDLGLADGPVATYLHGYPSSSLDLAPVAGILADTSRLLTLDLPGFGASAKPTDHRYSIHAAADAVEVLWASKAIDRTVLVAHDYGASVGQELLARRADGALGVDVIAVVWMNGGVYPDLHRPTAGQQMLLDPDHGAELAAAVTEEMFTEGIRGTWGARRELPADDVHEMWCSMDERGGVALMHDLLHYVADRREHEARWREALESFDRPTWFVWGDLDPVSGAHMIERVEQRVPGARVVRLADVGHWPPLEAPDVVAAAMADALGLPPPNGALPLPKR
jgi:pimeloyl-ACP methyl ester carboxylesterase